jgi:hypothetical protein
VLLCWGVCVCGGGGVVRDLNRSGWWWWLWWKKGVEWGDGEMSGVRWAHTKQTPASTFRQRTTDTQASTHT